MWSHFAYRNNHGECLHFVVRQTNTTQNTKDETSQCVQLKPMQCSRGGGLFANVTSTHECVPRRHVCQTMVERNHIQTIVRSRIHVIIVGHVCPIDNANIARPCRPTYHRSHMCTGACVCVCVVCVRSEIKLPKQLYFHNKPAARSLVAPKTVTFKRTPGKCLHCTSSQLFA